MHRNTTSSMAQKFAAEVMGINQRKGKRARAPLPVCKELPPTDHSQSPSDEAVTAAVAAKYRRLDCTLNMTEEQRALFYCPMLQRLYADEQGLVLRSAIFPGIQPDLSQRGHVRLMAFFVEVMIEQRLHFDTVLHAMQLFDSIVARKFISRTDILMVGAACLTLVCKLEEIYPIDIPNMSNAANNVFSADELFRMERKVLFMTDFRLSFATRLKFSRYFRKLLSLSDRQALLVDYLIGISYADFNLNYFPHSQVAAAAIHYALQLTRPGIGPVWSTTHAEITRYSEVQLLEIIVRIRQLHWNMEKYPLSSLVAYFATDSRLGVSEIHAIAYSNLRVQEGSGMLPKLESNFPLPNRSGIQYVYHFPTQSADPRGLQSR